MKIMPSFHILPTIFSFFSIMYPSAMQLSDWTTTAITTKPWNAMNCHKMPCWTALSRSIDPLLSKGAVYYLVLYDQAPDNNTLGDEKLTFFRLACCCIEMWMQDMCKMCCNIALISKPNEMRKCNLFLNYPHIISFGRAELLRKLTSCDWQDTFNISAVSIRLIFNFFMQLCSSSRVFSVRIYCLIVYRVKLNTYSFHMNKNMKWNKMLAERNFLMR